VLTGNKLVDQLKKLPLDKKQGEVFRMIHIQFQKTTLSAIGSRINGGRYNISQQFPGQDFEALYTSDSPITVLQELEFLINTPLGLIPFKREPYLLLSLEYSLQFVLDLTDINNQNYLGTNLQELTGV
jgi:RES domain-containing protein